MIAGIFGSQGIDVSGGMPALPYVTPAPSSTTVDGRPCYNGDVRYMSGSYQIFNNGYWLNTSVQPQIGLSAEIKSVIAWSLRKMEEEKELEKLMAEHQSIKDTKLQLDVLVAMLKDENA